MKPSNSKISTIHGLAAPMMINDIDTDIIIPAQHLTQVSKQGYGAHAFARLKQSDSNFVLNRPAFATADVLISGQNFGCGSSREHAVWAIQELGFKAIIAASFADIFANNARKNGLVLIEQPQSVCDQLASAAAEEPLPVCVDLLNQIIHSTDLTVSFEINPFFQHCITQGKSELDYLMSYLAAIKAHHEQAKNQHIFLNQSGAKP